MPRIAPGAHLAVEQVADDRHKEDGVLFRQHPHPQGQAAEERGKNAPVITAGQVEAQQHPEDHQVVQQHLALVVDSQRRQVEEETGHHGRHEAAREATGGLEKQVDAHQVHQQHQHPARVDRVAEGLELVGQQGHPAGDDQPACRRMVIVVRIGREQPLAQHRPRPLHVDALVSDVEGIEEQVVAMRDGPREQRAQQQHPGEHGLRGAHIWCWLLGAPPVLADPSWGGDG